MSDDLNTSADIFANSSAETVEENVNCMPPSDVVSPDSLAALQEANSTLNSTALVDNFVAETLPYLPRLYCPFCPADYGYEFLLKDHIKGDHSQELKAILSGKTTQVEFYPCPFCQAKFHVKELLPKHILRKHELCVVNMFSGFSPDKYITCRFCSHKTLRKHFKLLMVHLEKKHLQLFQDHILDTFSNIKIESTSIKSVGSHAALTDIILSPGLSEDFMKLSTKEAIKCIMKPSPVKSILKRTSLKADSPSTRAEKLEAFCGDNHIKSPVRRRLRFNLPDSPEEQSALKKLATLRQDKHSMWKFLRKNKKNKENVNPAPSTSGKRAVKRKSTSPESNPKKANILATPLQQYKCGTCSAGFIDNSQLVSHIRYNHRGLKLKAQYRCGVCSAKFFRNSYLVKHSWEHHKPLCLLSINSPLSSNTKF